MKIKNKHVLVEGFRHEQINEHAGTLRRQNFDCIVTNDRAGKTLSITDGKIQFIIPFEPLEKYLK